MSIITITRGTKSGGLELSNLLSKKLGYQMLGREELIAESSKSFNIMEDILYDKLEKSPNLWQKFTNEYGKYIVYVQCSLLRAIKQDNIIYHGYSGQFLLRGLPHVLNLRIDAPLDYRVKPVMSELNYNYDQAAEYITKVDDKRKRWSKMVYGEDWYNPSLFDLWINLQNMSMDNLCDMVSLAVNHKDFKTSENSLIQLDNMSLECEVRAALASDDKIWRNQELTVTAHTGVVTLRGRAKNKELRDLIVDTVKKVKGVKDCNPNINLLSDSLSK